MARYRQVLAGMAAAVPFATSAYAGEMVDKPIRGLGYIGRVRTENLSDKARNPAVRVVGAGKVETRVEYYKNGNRKVTLANGQNKMVYTWSKEGETVQMTKNGHATTMSRKNGVICGVGSAPLADQTKARQDWMDCARAGKYAATLYSMEVPFAASYARGSMRATEMPRP